MSKESKMLPGRLKQTGPAMGSIRHRKRMLLLALASAIAGCAVIPQPFGPDEREKLAAQARESLFAGQEPLTRPLTLEDAVARAIKYQADYRQRIMEQALAEAQVDVAKFDLLPKFTVNAGYSTRSNESFGFGFSPNGQIAANPSASTERTHTTTSVGFAWNVLDFGVSYFRARQLANQTLIADERRRKAVQTLMHDVRNAWWRAEAAQRLLPQADALLDEVEQSIERTRAIESRKLLPPLQTATLRRALQDLNQQVAFRRQELAQAQVELASLIGTPPGNVIGIASPAGTERDIPELTADVDKLEALALRARPEMPEEGYRAKVSEDEARKALVSLLPGLSFDLARMTDSNRFLVNNAWTSAGVSVVFNLVKVFSLPALNRSAEAQEKTDEARRLAMAMAIMAQTRLAAVRYRLVAEEFWIWDEASRDDDLIVRYLVSSAQAGVDAEIELIRSKARAMASRMNRDLSYANLQSSVARLYHSVGYDAIPREAEGRPLDDLATMVRARFSELEKVTFTPRADPARPSVAIVGITGASGRIAELIGQGARRMLDASRVPTAAADVAELQLQIVVVLEPPQEGKVGARASVAITRRDGAPGAKGEFKTSLSDPVDDEQWRILGEGALYRLLGNLAPARGRVPVTRQAAAQKRAGATEADAENNSFSELDGGPLKLKPAAKLWDPPSPALTSWMPAR
jgi:outer membrane protein TolC